MKKVYIFDDTNGGFLEERDAFLSPVDGEPLLPANGTFLKPPTDMATGEAAVFKNGEWHVVPDHRGRDAYDCATRSIWEITALGELPPAVCLLDDGTVAGYRSHPDHYRLSEDGIIRLSTAEIENLEVEKRKKSVRSIRDDLFVDADWRVTRAEDAIRLDLAADAAADTIDNLASYRQYLRDFTKLEDWWDSTPANYDQWRAER
jgi:hypothetical protein